MKLYIAGRQMGKTTKLINYAKEHNCAIVEPTYGMAKLISNSHDIDGSGIPVICIKELLKGNSEDAANINKNCDGILIDDATMCIKTLLKYFTTATVEGMAINVDVPFLSLDTDDSDNITMKQMYNISANKKCNDEEHL